MTNGQDVPTVEVADVDALVRGGAVLLDVREPEEWYAGHAPGATWIPLGRVPAERAALPTDRPVLAVCRVGGRSAQAVAALRRWGVDARNVAGGMQAWAAAGLPVVTDDDRPGHVV
ncbi:MAG TPA: rhodanese-like domain-containing protein [Acidimicrobiia bacterium]|nr:rhodanese-like domain-containing protein [Acidimicrobiia bacterium]